VVHQVVDRSLAGRCLLGSKPEESYHSQATVLDFLHFQFVQRTSDAVSGQTQRIKRSSRVARHTGALECSFKTQERARFRLATRFFDIFQALDFHKVMQEELHHQKRSERNGAVFDGHLSSLIPFWDIEHTELGQEVGDEYASNPKHGPAAVLELSIAVPDYKGFEVDFSNHAFVARDITTSTSLLYYLKGSLPVEGCFVGSKVQGIKSKVSGEGTVQMGWWRSSGLPQWAGSGVDGDGAASLQDDSNNFSRSTKESARVILSHLLLRKNHMIC
jgi:hypothetical protein